MHTCLIGWAIALALVAFTLIADTPPLWRVAGSSHDPVEKNAASDIVSDAEWLQILAEPVNPLRRFFP